MANSEQSRDTWVQPARSEPIWEKLKRPPLDWGDEEPDPVWERLYYRGEVNPPYPGREDRKRLIEEMRSWKPLGKPMTNDELMCALGRCQHACCQ